MACFPLCNKVWLIVGTVGSAASCIEGGNQEKLSRAAGKSSTYLVRR